MRRGRCKLVGVLNGETALLTDWPADQRLIQVQFDNLALGHELTHGWHLFLEDWFEDIPSAFEEDSPATTALAKAFTL